MDAVQIAGGNGERRSCFFYEESPSMKWAGVSPVFFIEVSFRTGSLITKYYFTVMPMKCQVKTEVFLCYSPAGVGIYLESKTGHWTSYLNDL